ncbi:MAG: acyltransferase [Rhizobiaceae bacterium]|jgi:peptidoglycan/LPS O-acetylase OafA/YrhL|nr:acyltransferase [Rhizobiaceae bacterium]
MQRRTFDVLDGLRGVAAIAVVERHKTDFLTGGPMPAGYLAVDLFFILSGFVLAHAYLDRLTAPPGTASHMGFRGFLGARLIRLAPLYLLALVAAALMHAAVDLLHTAEATNPALLAASFVAGVFLLPVPPAWSVHPGWLFPLNEPSWSLAFEMAVNLLFAAAILLMRPRILIGIIAAAFVWLAFIASRAGSLDVGFDWSSATGGIPRVVFGFFLGVLLHRAWRLHFARIALSGPLATAAAWLLAATLVLTMLAPVAAGWRASYELAVVLLVYPALILAGACLAPTGLSRTLLVQLGAASYAIYVLHMPLARAFNALFHFAGSDGAAYAPWTGFAFIALLVVTCLALDRWFDRPVRRWLTVRSAGALKPASHGPKADWPRPVTR